MAVFNVKKLWLGIRIPQKAKILMGYKCSILYE